ncbi:MAG: adenylyl-sulfate kinase [Nitrospirota bacterium]|jgi:adenylylsulfate kinase
MGGRALWITGIPGSGKSALARALAEELPGLVVLRMDDLRKVATPEPTYSEEERDVLYRALVFTASTLAGLGHDVLIDATGNLRRWRELARALIPRFAEVYLRCPLKVARAREASRAGEGGAPPDIYKKGEEGWPVPGFTAPYEEPLHPELTLQSESLSLREEAARVRRLLGGEV